MSAINLATVVLPVPGFPKNNICKLTLFIFKSPFVLFFNVIKSTKSLSDVFTLSRPTNSFNSLNTSSIDLVNSVSGNFLLNSQWPPPSTKR